MASWSLDRIKHTFNGILKISDDNSGVTDTLKDVQSANGVNTAMQISTLLIKARPGTKFEGDGSGLTELSSSQITNFDVEVANNSEVTANTAKVSNATHTGEVTGSEALTITNGAVSNAKIANDAVTYAKMQNVSATSRVLGRKSAGSGSVEELSPADIRLLIGGDAVPRQFPYIDRIDLGVTGTRPHAQGADSDGFFIYGSTDTILKKFNRDSPYTLQATNSSPLTGGTAMTQINGIFAKDDWLYVGASDWSSSPTPPNRGYIRRYLKSTLAYVDEFQVGTTSSGDVGWTEGASFYDGFWWVSYFDVSKISKFTESWVWVADYDVNAATSGGQGGRWLNNVFYRPISTSGTIPQQQYIEQYIFDGTNFNLLRTLETATFYANQGMGKEPGSNTFYFGECRYDLATPTNNIVICGLD